MRHDDSRIALHRLFLIAWVAVPALSGCQEGADVPQVIATIADKPCLPFQDPQAIEAAIGGTWRVRTLETTVSLVSCENPTFDGRVVRTDRLWVTYQDPFLVTAERFPPLYALSGVADGGRERFTARIDSYDCATSATIFESAAMLWFLCAGRFVPETGRVSGACTGAEIDTYVNDEERQGTCDLSEPFFFDMEHIPG